ncbi:MAG TPA: Asp23/Gls24 family envelope stress response protein [Streptosporangiaceae bacterium]|nr:Asp23/Gls24 family envelope stress response protein [Streptosporangiaceae bacterium]
MTQQTQQQVQQGQQRDSRRPPLTEEAAPPALQSSHGKTTIADMVVTKIASIAAREVPGVFDLGGGMSRALGAMRERIPGSRGPATSRGVSVEVGERQAAVDLTLVAEYGVPIADMASGVRRNVIDSIERMTSLEVTEVNIDVTDVYIPGEDGSGTGADAGPARVE